MRGLILVCFLFISFPAWSEDITFASEIGGGLSLLRTGQYILALERFESAQKLATSSIDKALADGWIGFTRYRRHQYDSAQELMTRGVNAKAGTPHDQARWYAALGDIAGQVGKDESALDYYETAAALAKGSAELEAAIALGRAELLSPEDRIAELKRIAATLPASLPPDVQARMLINAVVQAQEPELKEATRDFRYNCLVRATEMSSGRERAEALSILAQMFEDEGQDKEALRVNSHAIDIGEKAGANDLLIVMEWRNGRLFKRMRRDDEALAAYEKALEHIESIRVDIPVEYHSGHSSFRETLEPVYLGLADLLLEKARKSSGDNTQLLSRARDTVELIKQSELEDFLGGRCAVQAVKATKLEVVQPDTAILYPIILPERLEILVSINSEFKHFSQAVLAPELQRTVRQFAKALRQADPSAIPLSQQVYKWMIAPVDPWLSERKIRTLVVVPDGVLRLIPIAALNDGKRYLVERYEMAVSPGLSIMEPKPLTSQGRQTLIAGMSQPGPVVGRLPSDFLAAFGGLEGRGFRQQPEGVSSRSIELESKPENDGDKAREAEVQKLLRDPDFLSRLKKALSLPGVDQEIASLKQSVTGTTLMNEQFTVDGFRQAVLGNPFSVIHIASHGVFGESASTSFVMAYDGVIDMDQLEGLLKSDKFNSQPIELLTLSACQTAEGDDRAPLGISGIALKAHVRSALGSLWPVNDEAAAKLMAAFYRELARPGVNKVKALQLAQRSLLQEQRFQHPFFWAPFIIAGNWL